MGRGEVELIYLYCVTNRAPKLKDAENLVDKLYSVYHKGLYAVVSKVSEDEFGEENLKKNLADLDWIKEKASIHERVIEGVMRNTCIIPFKFGTIFNTEDNLKTMLAEHAEKFKENLKNLEGKEEWGIKVYCDIEKLRKTISQEDEELLTIDKEISSTSTGKAFFLKKKKEDLLNTGVNKKLNEYGKASFERLSEQSLKARINKLLPREVTERKDDMILNAAFLVDKNKVREFVQEVDGLKAKYEDSGLNFDCTGPWPPYNFCQMKPGLMERSEPR